MNHYRGVEVHNELLYNITIKKGVCTLGKKRKKNLYYIYGPASMGGDEFLIENYTKKQDRYTTASSEEAARRQFKKKFTKLWGGHQDVYLGNAIIVLIKEDVEE